MIQSCRPVRILIATAVLAAAISYPLGATAMNRPETIYDIPVVTMNEKADATPTTTTLASHKGKVLLLINVASKCGYTKQYAGLEKLHRAYKDRGVVVLGFPCNDFGGQEPGTEAEILEFCKTTYDVTFPLYGKLHAKGGDISPLYKWLTAVEAPFPGEVRWNFEKFVISKEGKIAARFRSGTTPESKELLDAIEKELVAK